MNLENENHSEGCAEREYSKEKMDSHEEADPQGYCDVDRDRMGSCYHFNHNLVKNVFLEHVLTVKAPPTLDCTMS